MSIVFIDRDEFLLRLLMHGIAMCFHMVQSALSLNEHTIEEKYKSG